MELPESYAALPAFKRYEYIDAMRVEVSELQATLDELSAATPRSALARYSHSLLPVGTNLGLRLRKTCKASPSKLLRLEKFASSSRGSTELGFVTTAQDGMALLWDAALGLKFEALSVGKGNMMSIDVNPGARVAAAGGLSCAVDLYSVGQQLSDLIGDKDEPFEFPVSPYQPLSNEAHSKQFRLTLSGHDAAISDLQFLTESLLVSGSQDGGVCIWDIQVGTTLVSSMQAGGIVAISRSTDNVFCTAASDGKLKVWDVRTRASEARWFGLPQPLNDCVFMPEGASVLTSDDAGMTLFDLRTSTPLELYRLGGALVTAFDVSSSGRFAFVGTDVGVTVPLDLLQNRVLQPLETRHDRVSSVKVIGTSVFTANWDGSVRTYSPPQDAHK